MTLCRPSTRLASLLLTIVLSSGAPRAARAQMQVLETRDLRMLYHGPTLSFIAPYTARCFENSMRFHRQCHSF